MVRRGWVGEDKSIFNIWPGLACLGRQTLGQRFEGDERQISGNRISDRWNFEKIEEEENAWFMQGTEMSPL